MTFSLRKFALVLLWTGGLLLALARPDTTGGIAVLALFLTYTVALFPSDFWNIARGLPVLFGQSVVAVLAVVLSGWLQPGLLALLPWLQPSWLLWAGFAMGAVAVLMALRIGPNMLDEAMAEAERRLGGELGADLAARQAQSKAAQAAPALPAAEPLPEPAEAPALAAPVEAAPEVAPAVAAEPAPLPEAAPPAVSAPEPAPPAAPAAPAIAQAEPQPAPSARETLAALAAVPESSLPALEWDENAPFEEARWSNFTGTLGRLGALLADPETEDARIEAALDKFEHSPDTVEELRLAAEDLDPEEALRLQLLLIARPWVAADWIPGEAVLVLLSEALEGAGPQSHRGLAMAEAWRGRGGRLLAGERELLLLLTQVPSRLPPGRIRDRLRALLARLDAA